MGEKRPVLSKNKTSAQKQSPQNMIHILIKL